MNFIEAVKAMQDGKRVTNPLRNSANQSYVMSKKFTGCGTYIEEYTHGINNYSNYRACLDDVDYLSNDWEIKENIK